MKNKKSEKEAEKGPIFLFKKASQKVYYNKRIKYLFWQQQHLFWKEQYRL